jgi:hypothetical protein
MLVHCSSHFADHLVVRLQLSSQTLVDPLEPEDRLLVKRIKGKHGATRIIVILFFISLTSVYLTKINFVYTCM